MSGKASIFLVLGFGLIFSYFVNNINSYSTDSVVNMVDYYNETKAHNIAASGANIAANKLFFNPTWTTGMSNVSFSEGTFDVNIDIIDTFQNVRRLTSTGTYNGVTKTVEVILRPSKFSKFAYYSENEPSHIWWTSTDTVWGPLHVQDYLNVYEAPVFFGKATSLYGLKKYYGYYGYPRFYGGYESGVDLPLPHDGVSNLEIVADDNGYKFSGEDTVHLSFYGDSLNYRFHKHGPDTTVLTSDLAPNGVIFAENSVLRIKGTIKGRYTLGCSGSSSKGNIFIDDDIVYHKDPRENPNSQDLLGIVAKNNVYVADNTSNQYDIDIHGAIYCEDGGFGAENYDTRPPSGAINLLGGISQHVRRAVGTFDHSGIQSGFNKRYRYDDRLMLASPPYFPRTNSYEIVSWYE
jgi:hypothetical protein